MIKLFLLLIFLSAPAIAHAEGGCPQGEYPQTGNGWRTCVPIPGQSTQNSAQPARKWMSNWQAFAVDAPKGILGSSRDQPTSASAKSAAMADCEGQGGTACEIGISVRDACMTMVIGDSTLSFKGGTTKAEADQAAMNDCREGNKTCTIHRSSCNFGTSM